MENKRCFFCGANATSETSNMDKKLYYSCPNCGEYYLVADSIRQFNENESLKKHIPELLSERKVHKKPPVIISNSVNYKFPDLLEPVEVTTIEELLKTYPQNALEMTERILLSLAKFATVPFRKLHNSKLPFHAFFCHTKDNLSDVLEYCETAGWVKNDHAKEGSFLITPRGWERINELRKRLPGEKPQIFVAMWFSEEVEEIYKAIKATVETTCQLKICRIDEKEYNGNICDEMFAEIQRSSAMIADYTGNRPNVYYEAGYAKGLGIPVIMLIRKSDLKSKKKKPHFDIAQYNFIVYENPEDLQKHLYQRLRSMFPQIP